MPRNPEIIIVDPDPDARSDAKHMLTTAHFTVVGESDYGIDAVTVAKEHPPDIFLVIMEEPLARAIQTFEMLGAAAPEAAVIIASSLTDAASVRRAMVVGAPGGAAGGRAAAGRLWRTATSTACLAADGGSCGRWRGRTFMGSDLE